ncbi:hypothetical protein Tco_1217035 [Tanacetum coccineum]
MMNQTYEEASGHCYWTARIQAVEKERKAKNILHEAIPKNIWKISMEWMKQKKDGKQRRNQMGLLTMVMCCQIGENILEAKKHNNALRAISSSNEANEIMKKMKSFKRDRRIGMKAVKKREQLQKTVDPWIDSSKIHLGFIRKTFVQYIYKRDHMSFKGSQKPEFSVSDDNSSEHSTCQSNDSKGSCGNTSEHSFETESKSLVDQNEFLNWGSAVKTSASYNWRNSRPDFNYSSGPTFIRTVNANGPQGSPKPAKAWVPKRN